MTIDELNALTTLTAGDELPVWDVEVSAEEPTKKITAQNMAASVKTLGSLVNTSEMNTALAGKQNTLTFDSTPTAGSTNPVTSGGIADAIAQSAAIESNGSFKSPNGTLIQWGIIEGAKNGDHISYSIPYVGNTPSITIAPYYNSITTIRCILIANPQPSQTDFVLYAYDTSTGAMSTSTTLQARWIAIGRWK